MTGQSQKLAPVTASLNFRQLYQNEFVVTYEL